MTIEDPILKQVHAAFEFEPRIHLHQSPIEISLIDGQLVLQGEVPDIAARKLALRQAESISGVTNVVDRLYVHPVEPRGDGAVLVALAQALQRNCDLRNCTLRQHDKGQVETLHEAVGDDACGEIEFSVTDGGIVRLDGHVISLSHRRLAEVLAWWTPGCRHVDNRLAVVPGEQDTDDEITDALRLVLETDPAIHADQISVNTILGVVTLDGVVTHHEERRTAELDAWYIPGVNEVVNRLELRP